MKNLRESDPSLSSGALPAIEFTSDDRERACYPSKVNIDPAAVAANVRWLKTRVGDRVSLMAVVKANAYGHGAVEVAQISLENGADLLAVANIEEATELRIAGIRAPILVLGYVPAAAIPRAIELDISVSIYDCLLLSPYLRAMKGVGGILKVHVKVDSGMGRLGVALSEVTPLARELSETRRIQLEGIYTHFATADDNPRFTSLQLTRFKQVVSELERAGLSCKYVHAANSAAVLNCRDSYLNLIRAGLLLYGLNPLAGQQAVCGLRPAMTWKTVVAQIKTLPPGSPVGYGNAYHTRDQETIAVLPIGYADGLRRSPRTWREVLVHGMRVPLVGAREHGESDD